MPTTLRPRVERWELGDTESPISPDPTFSRVLEGLPSEVSDKISVGTLRHPSLRLRNPLHLTISRENETVIVECRDINEFGYGAHLTEAIEDFQKTVVELYSELKTAEARLGANLQQLWQKLMGYIEER